MATRMTVSEARALLPQIVQRVQAGEEVTLTRHGEAVAVVLRPDRLRARRAEVALARAEELHEAVQSGRERPLGAISSTMADDVLAHAEWSRASR